MTTGDQTLRRLDIPAPSRTRTWVTRALVGVVVAGAVAAVAIAVVKSGSPSERGFETARVTRGDIVSRVTATGSLSPRRVVDVGAEISGRVAAVHADVNSRVAAGDLLVELDTTELEAALNEARANVASAEAAVATSRAGLSDAENRQERSRALHERNLEATAEHEAVTATLSRSQAELRGARARLEVARATLERARANIDNARILAPIDGIVLVRSIEPGQTVAAAFQAPVLFQIAEDLTRMELHVDVDEADVGRVREGQRATFTVDAYADRTFDATITRLAFASHLSERVVVYEAVLAVENPELLLRPGMTATASIETGREANVLIVPNRALRFRPPSDGPFAGRRTPPPPGPTVYVLEDAVPKVLSVETGATDGNSTAIRGEQIAEGLEVLVGLAREEP